MGDHRALPNEESWEESPQRFMLRGPSSQREASSVQSGRQGPSACPAEHQGSRGASWGTWGQAGQNEPAALCGRQGDPTVSSQGSGGSEGARRAGVCGAQASLSADQPLPLASVNRALQGLGRGCQAPSGLWSILKWALPTGCRTVRHHPDQGVCTTLAPLSCCVL